VSKDGHLKRYILTMLFAGVVALSGTACSAAADQDDVNDPLESMNRAFFDFDMFLDHILLTPAAQVYVAVVPEVGRRSVRHVLDNMNEPIIFANNILQGEFHRADVTLGRFLLNSTFGLAGIFDWATGEGPAETEWRFRPNALCLGIPLGTVSVLASTRSEQSAGCHRLWCRFLCRSGRVRFLECRRPALGCLHALGRGRGRSTFPTARHPRRA